MEFVLGVALRLAARYVRTPPLVRGNRIVCAFPPPYASPPPLGRWRNVGKNTVDGDVADPAYVESVRFLNEVPHQTDFKR